MAVKYYTHFIAQERGAIDFNEYRGVVELRGAKGRISEDHEIARVLARSFDLHEDDIRVLQWTQLH